MDKQTEHFVNCFEFLGFRCLGNEGKEKAMETITFLWVQLHSTDRQ